MTKKRGRPKKGESERREDLLVVRLEALEKQAFQQAAGIAGVGMSSWARERLRLAAIRELEQAGLRPAFLASFYSSGDRVR